MPNRDVCRAKERGSTPLASTKSMKEVNGKQYDKNDWYWAVMHKKHIVAIYPRFSEARQHAFHSNKRWEANGWAPNWTTKRFRFYFKGSEIDAYEHEWQRTEKLQRNEDLV